MNLCRRYLTALSRRRRSAGYGIHSPFGFKFVREVIAQPLPYYNYALLRELRRRVIASRATPWPHSDVIPLSEAKLLFRLANRFQPENILQIGTSYGIAAASLRYANTEAHLYVCLNNGDTFANPSEHIHPYNRIARTLAEYGDTRSDRPFVVVNSLVEANQADTLAQWLRKNAGGKSTVIVRNLHRNTLCMEIWSQFTASLTNGQTYTNHKIGIAVVDPKLQREHFNLWI